jgi:hypothetical protein
LDRIHQLGIAHGQQEVLVAFRGRLPVSLFEVVSSDTGLGQGLLPEVGQVPCIDWICKVMDVCAVISILDFFGIDGFCSQDMSGSGGSSLV